MDAADAVAEIDAIVAARTFYRTIASGEDDRLALAGGDDLGFRLHAGLLFNQEKFPALPIASGLTKQENHLQRESDLTVEILVQAVVAATFVVEDQRCRPDLARLVADIKECVVTRRKGWFGLAKGLGPLVGDRGEVRIGTGAKVGDNFRQRIGKVFVIANAEAVTLHDDVAAEAGGVVI